MSDNIPSPEGADFDPSTANIPDCLKDPKDRELTREQIERRLKARFGIEADELKVLYSKDEDLKKFYLETVLKASSLTGNMEEDSKDPIKKDGYKLSKSEKLEVENLRLIEKRRERRKAKLKEKVEEVKDEKQKTDFEAAGSHLPLEERVTFADAQQAIADILGKRKK